MHYKNKNGLIVRPQLYIFTVGFLLSDRSVYATAPDTERYSSRQYPEYLPYSTITKLF